MQSPSFNPSPAAPFTFCLFLDDHFPIITETSQILPDFPIRNNVLGKFKQKEEEALTQRSSQSEGANLLIVKDPLFSPERRGFFLTDESDSDSGSFETKLCEIKAKDLIQNIKENSVNIETEESEIKIETRSLEILNQKQERKQGFSIWSCIAPDLGLGMIEMELESSFQKNDTNVTVNKLRNSLKGSHFKRIESKLRKLLDRRKREF